MALGLVAAASVFFSAAGALGAEPKTKAPEGAAQAPAPLAVTTTPELPAAPARQDATGHKERVNLWPFIYYSYDPARGEKQLNFLGPIIRSGESGGGELLRPEPPLLLHHEQEDR